VGNRWVGAVAEVGQRGGLVGLMVAALVLSWPSLALANGGTIQLGNEPAGPYRVTVMTSPSPLIVGTADVSVMVTSADMVTVVPDATVLLIVTPVGKTAAATRYPATHANATNRLFYAANIPFTQTGRYAFTIQVTGPNGGGNVRFDADVSKGFLGMTPFEVISTALPIAGFIAFAIFASRTRRTPGVSAGKATEDSST